MTPKTITSSVELKATDCSQDEESIFTSTPKNIDSSKTNFEDTETVSNYSLVGNVSDHKLCVETDISASSSYTDTVISKNCTGRRIVDIMYVFEQIQNSKHQGGAGCSFLNMIFLSEKRYGFRSSFIFKCKMCNIKCSFESEKSEPENYISINQAIVSGTIAAGIGYTQLAEVLVSADIPCMSNTTYNAVLLVMSESIHNAALKEMQLAGEEEKKLAIEAGEIDDDGTPMCTVVADGQWSKRSYKTKYDALSGVATIIGYKSKKILFIGIRNRYCVICQRYKNKKTENSTNHTCFMNWSKGATSMEADAIAEGFKKSVEMHGLKYNKLIGDGDSSVTKRLNEIIIFLFKKSSAVTIYYATMAQN
uniref:Mutator-like transposase domain-containing protein n=1 Tax=Schizaphis graminum TaxID=13262 RepID=A0A2S2NH11_SCHGA